jgi:hypothetical protein
LLTRNGATPKVATVQLHFRSHGCGRAISDYRDNLGYSNESRWTCKQELISLLRMISTRREIRPGNHRSSRAVAELRERPCSPSIQHRAIRTKGKRGNKAIYVCVAIPASHRAPWSLRNALSSYCLRHQLVDSFLCGLGVASRSFYAAPGASDNDQFRIALAANLLTPRFFNDVQTHASATSFRRIGYKVLP